MTPSAEVLARILLLQNMITILPDADAIFSFVSRGLSELPGVQDVNFQLPPIDQERTVSTQSRVFPVIHRDMVFGTLIITISNNEFFDPYASYINNFCAMIAVVLDERSQRAQNKLYQEKLEDMVEDRTTHLYREIEARRQAEKALQLEKEQLQVIINSIGDGFIATDTEGRVILMNHVAEELCGYTLSEAKGRLLIDIFVIVNEETRKVCDNPVQKVLESGQIVELANHTLLISRDGTERPIADSGAPIRDAMGNTRGVVLVFRDQTEKQKLIGTLERISKLDSLGLLAGGIAHDFNNLLGGIFAFIDMANHLSAEQKVKTYLTKAMGAMERARALTDQLLTFSKGGTQVQVVTQMKPYIQDTIQFALSGSKVTAEYDISNDLGNCIIDPNQVGQVLDNIVINAVQAMPLGGTITIRAQHTKLADKNSFALPGGTYVDIAIIDQGIGISRDMLSKIFDPFFTTKTQGQGLGLATSFSIIHRHHGIIDVQSELGKGSTFRILIPTVSEGCVRVSPERAEQHVGSGVFMVMDDEVIIRESVSEMLKSMGYSVIQVANGDEAVTQLSDHLATGQQITGLIFDLTISGGKGGKETITEIRALHPEIPVIVFSGYAEDPVLTDPKAYGFTASLSKPFRQADLEKLLNQLLPPA